MKSPENLPASVRQRILNRAKSDRLINDNYFFPVTTIKIPVFHSIQPVNFIK